MLYAGSRIFCSDVLFLFITQDLIQASANRIISSFPRLHTLLIGPGLGRNGNVLSVVSDVILAARDKNMP